MATARTTRVFIAAGTIIALLALIGAALAGGWYYYRSQQTITPALVKRYQMEGAGVRKPVIWREIASPAAVAGSRKPVTPLPSDSRPATAEGASDIPQPENATTGEPAVRALPLEQVCAADWNLAASTELSLLQHQMEQGMVALTPDCALAMQGEGGAEHKDINGSGGGGPDALAWFARHCHTPGSILPESRDRCVSLVPEYRIFAIGMIFGNQEQLSDLETPALAGILTRRMAGLKDARLDELDQTIRVADEIILRQPDVYSAHKARAVALALKEMKFGVEMDEGDFSSTMETLAEFTGVDRTFAIREEALLLDARSRLEALESQLDDITARREELEDDVAGTEELTADDSGADLSELAQTEELLQQQIDELAARLESGILSESDAADADVVKIPFLRLLARGDHDALIEEARFYVDAYPGSPVGYHFLAQGLWRSGDQPQALQVLKMAAGDDAHPGLSQSLLLDLFQKTADKTAVEILSNIEVRIDGG